MNGASPRSCPAGSEAGTPSQGIGKGSGPQNWDYPIWNAGSAGAGFPFGPDCSAVSLLLTHLGDISAQALGPSSATDALSARHYQHTDPGTGAVLLCDKCPAGTYVSKHCTESAVRECESCPEGTFTRGENGVQQCHRCRKPCQPPLVEKSPCTGASDRACVCPPGTFANGATCRSHTACGKGWGVRKKGSEAEDVKCKPCPTGTFSDVSSSVLKCRTHTNCTALGLPTLAEGTRESDGTCGPPSANALALMSAPLSPAQPITLGAASEIVVHKETSFDSRRSLSPFSSYTACLLSPERLCSAETPPLGTNSHDARCSGVRDLS
ncbi:hypothetical protein Z043_102827 [Scleropages formosus]|uniref:TNFR-Cys domain-containing protein n=1 Tax=Scleropages formosus TaxID=113540 RepID=A0A0P7V6K4_SCLFO|nr:hypothetical protein Z043_102827 [Scleropages formosus]